MMSKFLTPFNIIRRCVSNQLCQKATPILVKQVIRPITISSVSRANKVSFTVQMDGQTVQVTGQVGIPLRDVIAHHRREKGEDFGICDGTVACSTCHVVFSESDFGKIPGEPTQEEIDVLDVVPNYTDTSRLSCAINISPELEGIVVKVPDMRFDARQLYSISELKKEI